VITPEHPSDAEKQLYLQLARQSRFNPRRESSPRSIGRGPRPER
jgi:hypothetical protein